MAIRFGRNRFAFGLVLFIIFIYFEILLFSTFKSTETIILTVESLNRSSIDTIFQTNNTNQSQISLAVVLSLAKNPSHIAEFYVLYESWRFIQNFSPLSDEILIDLIVFCEQPSCIQLPVYCLPLSTKNRFHGKNKCFYEELKTDIVEEWNDYLYMTSIAFMLTNEYKQAVNSYQWILRVDQDAVLSPALYLGLKQKHEIPLYKMQFGGLVHGVDFTNNRLKSIAQKLGYKHAGVHNLCSTWLVQPNDSIQLANLTTSIGKHFIRNEFGRHVQGLEDIPDRGDWPKWWYGVVSLYAAEIAINHFYFGQITSQHGTDALDRSAESTASIWSTWHIHCLHNPTPFDKFQHRDDLNNFLSVDQETRLTNSMNPKTTQVVLMKLIEEHRNFQEGTKKFSGTISVKDYVSALAWQKAYSATGAINF